MHSNRIPNKSFYFEMPFPLNASHFDALLAIPQYQLDGKKKVNEEMVAVTDGEILFHLVAAQMRNKGIVFTSPGNTPKRHFIAWFNNHFVTNQYNHAIAIKPKYFDVLYALLKQVYIENKIFIEEEFIAQNQTIVAFNDQEQLTDIGQQFLKELQSNQV